jgi:hypothetical protein
MKPVKKGTSSSFDQIWKKVQTERLLKKSKKSNDEAMQEPEVNHFGNEMLSEKYKPKHFYELIGDHKNNTDIISWMKAHKSKDYEGKENFYFDDSKSKVRQMKF